MLWVAWIRWEMINTRTTALPEERTEGAVIYRLLCHHFSHQSAYLGNRSAAEMSASIEAFAQKQKGQGDADGETTKKSRSNRIYYTSGFHLVAGSPKIGSFQHTK